MSYEFWIEPPLLNLGILGALHNFNFFQLNHATYNPRLLIFVWYVILPLEVKSPDTRTTETKLPTRPLGH